MREQRLIWSRRALVAVGTLVLTLAFGLTRALAQGDGRAQAPSACADAGASIARPPAIPRGFPVPTGTRFGWVQRTSNGTTLVVAHVPRSLAVAAAFFRRQVPRAGYVHTWGDAEPGEAEARFTGGSIHGSWRVNAIRGCAQASVLTLGFAGRPAGRAGA